MSDAGAARSRRPEGADRSLHFERRMSDAEALMWNVEKDPWLNPSGATVTIVDRPIDAALFRRRICLAVANIARLRQRVVPGVARLSAQIGRASCRERV